MTARDFADLTPFRTADAPFSQYTFPFVCLDPTPGGANLGRIEWCIELHPAAKRRGEKRRRIGEVWLWAKQTRDPRYSGKQFRIEAHAEGWGTHRLDGGEYAPWRILFCEEHKGAVIMLAYPQNHHTKLIFNAASSIEFEVHFE